MNSHRVQACLKDPGSPRYMSGKCIPNKINLPKVYVGTLWCLVGTSDLLRGPGRRLFVEVVPYWDVHGTYYKVGSIRPENR